MEQIKLDKETKKTAIKILKRAKELLSKKNAWTKGTSARDKNGFVASINAENACSFCALGALHRAAWDVDKQNNICGAYTLIAKAREFLPKKWKKNGIAFYNDKVAKDKRYIIRIFDKMQKAIEDEK